MKPVTGPDGDNPITDEQIRDWESEQMERHARSTSVRGPKWRAIDLATQALAKIVTLPDTISQEWPMGSLAAVIRANKRRGTARAKIAAAWNARHRDPHA